MKKSRIYSIVALIISLAVLCASLVAPSVARYVAETLATFTTVDTDGNEVTYPELNYTVNSVFEVKTQDELFAAINQGYTYVQLSQDIENPLIITESAENLERDLILDLNGIEIQRNGTEPILNIGSGVRLTVTDTSIEQTGGLYNPIGSVFNINGGILTVITGNFESGPRYSEYLSYNTDILSQSDTSTRRTVIESVDPVTLTVRSGDLGNYTYTTTKSVNMPIIHSYPEKTGSLVYNHGNLYFDSEVSSFGSTAFAQPISADTYIYYRTSEDNAALTNDPADADWYYTYFVEKDTYEYHGETLENIPADKKTDDYVLITIYGYEKVIQDAATMDKDHPENFYAAIQMQYGKLDIIEGGFFSYFGVDTTACVNAVGGELTISTGVFSSRIPNATSNAVITIKGDDTAAFEETYFNNFVWNNDDNTGGAQAKAGESYCILNNGNTQVSIGTGTFYSSNNNIVNMDSGTGSLTIDSGTFTKQLINPTNPTDFEFEESRAAIHTTSGTLTFSGNITVIGDYTMGVYAQGGTITMGNTATESSITINNNLGCYGIYSSSTDKTSIDITNTTINVGYKVASQKTEGSLYLASAGIFLAAPEKTDGTPPDSMIALTDVSINSHELGIAVRGGTLNITGTGVINTEKASAVAVYGGSITFDRNSTYTIESKNTTDLAATNVYNVYIHELGNTEAPTSTANYYPNTDGIYVSGGDFILNGTLDFTHTGLYNDVSNYTHYNNLKITSYAVRVAGGSVSLEPDSDNKHTVSINATIGGGVYCSDGELILGREDYVVDSGVDINSIVRVSTTGHGTYDHDRDEQSAETIHGVDSYGVGWGWTVPKQQLYGGAAIELYGGSITVNNGTYTAAFGDGVLAKIPYSTGTIDAEITINNGYFDGRMDGTKSETTYSGPAASYGVKVIGGAKVYINGGTFKGRAAGAAVTGVSNFTSTSNYSGNWAEVYVKAGTFGSIDDLPTDGFMVFDMAKVALGSAKAAESALSAADKITVWSKKCPISVNDLAGNYTPQTSYVYIYYGTYRGAQADVYNEGAFAYIKVYNVAPHASLNANVNWVIRTVFDISDDYGDNEPGTQLRGTTYYNNIAYYGNANYDWAGRYPDDEVRYFEDTDFTNPVAGY